MKYALLIYGNEAEGTKLTKEEQEKEFSDYYAYDSEVRQRGIYHGGEALHPVSAATTVRIRDGKKLITDGPFAETKEQLGGFYLLECKDLDEAIEWAAKIPGVVRGTVEIRPVLDFSQM